MHASGGLSSDKVSIDEVKFLLNDVLPLGRCLNLWHFEWLRHRCHIGLGIALHHIARCEAGGRAFSLKHLCSRFGVDSGLCLLLFTRVDIKLFVGFSETRLITSEIVACLLIAGIHDVASALVLVVTRGVRDHTSLIWTHILRIFTKVHQ